MAAVASDTMSAPALSPSPTLSMERSPSRRVADAPSSDNSSPSGTPDRSSQLDRSPSASRQLDFQNQSALRSKEYRQLFGLPEDEVHIQDFNCALQENMLLQGHMYLFSNYICFYANFLSFETKKVIPFHEVTCVKRAKVAGIFPTAIEISTEEKKFFFASFLSREEAFKLISDGWSKKCKQVNTITDQQEVQYGINSQENDRDAVEEVECSSPSMNDSDRNTGGVTSEDLTIPDEADGGVSPAVVGLLDKVEEVETVQSTACTSSTKSVVWEEEDCDAPEVPASFTMVAESKFPIKVEEFFNFFFSDEAVDFQDSFHIRCGDKDFKCTEWHHDGKHGHTREVSFQHPIKLYLGAKFGGCQEVQKYRICRNSHLMVETSQEINDVPYGDYFRVEGLWHVKRDDHGSKEGCLLSVYTNVNFSKKTIFKGKIVQSTVDECRDAYATWIDLAHELLKQKKVQEEVLVQNGQVPLQKEEISVKQVEESSEASGLRSFPSSKSGREDDVDTSGGSERGRILGTSLVRDRLAKLCSSMKVQSPVSLFLVLGIAVILLLMQISILTLLSRPQQIQVIPQADWTYGVNRGTIESASDFALLDRKIKNLKEEMHIFESLLERMQQEHASLKSRLSELELLRQRENSQSV
ncbi:OLC1v1038523C1 [Oldenlandia corymbosa var. corymbosa]|uniref:OLC1v1038523C1 n=1 Tax=Oldenlandia corymbosa var. corymbosa TaxID=529605 RepID=A0AAV1CZZ2_OLDCO|nr:OLC1v1038523C1 [Oldenlandia corymbosa var. corymbosa]